MRFALERLLIKWDWRGNGVGPPPNTAPGVRPRFLEWFGRPEIALILGIIGLVPPTFAFAADPIPQSRVHIDRIVIDNAFPNAYQVEVADVDGDGKPDLVALGGTTIAWYQNPTWTKRIIARGGDPLKGDIISSATTDLDGDGRAEIAIACDFAMNTPTRGQLWLATQGETSNAPWTLRKVIDVPSIHRVRWAAIESPDRLDLVVAPIFGPTAKPPTFDQDGPMIRAFTLHALPSGRPSGPGLPTGPVLFDIEKPRKMKVPLGQPLLVGGQVTHAIEVWPKPDRANDPLLLAACADGVMATVEGNDPQGHQTFPGYNVFPIPPGDAPKRGCSEVRLGQVAGHRFLATIEPWHGSIVAVRWQNPNPERRNISFGDRIVLDDTLDDGHALWLADVDGDGSDEIFAGHRGKDHRVAMYRFDGKTLERTILDTQIAAQDLRGGDLDADGVPDVVAVGGTTHNVVWYRPSRLKGNPADASVR